MVPKDLTILVFDFGLGHWGVAVGESLVQSIQPLGAVKAVKGVPQWRKIDALVADWKPDVLLMGLALSAQGADTPMSRAARRAARLLEKRYSLKCRFQDERYSSLEASQRQIQDPEQTSGRELHSDSAAIILRDWLRHAEENQSQADTSHEQ